MGREQSTETTHQGIRTPWHGAAVTIGSDRHLRALCIERGRRMVNGTVVGSAEPINGLGRSKVKTGHWQVGLAQLKIFSKFQTPLQHVNSKGYFVWLKDRQQAF
jgi:hypothetical protein